MLENVWRREWQGAESFYHGSGNSRRCFTLIRSTLAFKPTSVKRDENGRFLIVNSVIKDDLVSIVSVYAHNKRTNNLTKD